MKEKKKKKVLCCYFLLFIIISFVGYQLLRNMFPCNDELANSTPEEIAERFIHEIDGSGIPIIFTAVHGGDFSSRCIDERYDGFSYNDIKTQDRNTIEFMKDVNNALFEKVNQNATMIFTDLHRKHIDLNRDPSGWNVYQDSRLSTFHDFFYISVEEVIDNSISSDILVIDFHGFSTSLRPSNQRDVHVYVGTLSNKTMDPIVRESMINHLGKEGIVAYPNLVDRFDEPFSGDYNLKRFVGKDNYQGVQLEITNLVRFENQLKEYENQVLRENIINNLVDFLIEWIAMNS